MDAERIAKLIDTAVEPKAAHSELYKAWLEMSDGHTIDIGVEIEAIAGRKRGRYILPFENNDSDGYIMHTLLSRMQKKVFRDWYPHQLEIRAGPGRADKVVEELKTTIEEVQNILKSFKCGILFRSNFEQVSQTCGMHVHADLSILDNNLSELEKLMAVSYLPVLISYNLHRDVDSEHVRLRANRFVRHVTCLQDTIEKDRDFHISGARITSEGRHRLEKPITWETRVYDTSPLAQMYHAILMHSQIITKSLNLIEERAIESPKQLFANAVRYRGKFIGNEVTERIYHKALASFINWPTLKSEMGIRLNWMHSLDIFSRAMIKEIDGQDELIYQIYPFNRWRTPKNEDRVINVITHDMGKLVDEGGSLRVQAGNIVTDFDKQAWFRYYTFNPGRYYFFRANGPSVIVSNSQLETPSTKHLDDHFGPGVHTSPIPECEIDIVKAEIETIVKDGFVDLVSKPAFEAINKIYAGDRRAQCPL